MNIKTKSSGCPISDVSMLIIAIRKRDEGIIYFET